MSAAKCADELDFSLSFRDLDRDRDRDQDREEGGGGGGGAAGPGLSVRTQSGQPVNPELSLPSYYCTTDNYQHVGCNSQGPQYAAQGNLRAFDCPSIQITSIAANNHVGPHTDQEALAIGGAEGGYAEASWSRDQLYLPLDACYRDPAFCPSPCSSMSSRSWMSDLSSCESFSHIYDDVEGDVGDAARATLRSPLGSPLGSPGCGGGAFGVEIWQEKYQHPLAISPALSPHQSPRQSPCHSPRTSVTEESWLNRRPTSRPSSRPTSPCGKRRHSSAEPHTRVRSPSPHHSPSPTPSASPRESVTEEAWFGSPALGPLLMFNYHELDVPSKTRKTSGTQLGLLPSQGDPAPELFQDPPGEEGCEQDGLAELFLQVPSHFSWNKPKPGNAPLFRTSSPPPLDWPLPSQYEQCELRVDVQPKSYHRAHYETEGSRGSIKAAAGGHPVIQLIGYRERRVGLLVFIGTSDDRFVRPHPFYQVHRVTGKTVTTSCQEKIMGCTKVLEIPLLPESNMSASIDCVGILKLRNADIELKKGETDIGRKNTRVRAVFRVSVPQPDGQMLWLQTSSVPVECSQRSGQEVPQVESFSSASCSVDGGEELLITGSNISSQSRVVFMEKGPDGRAVWEVDARVVPEKSRSSSVVVEVPPYHKKTAGPVQVQFYISNGKRRRSAMQSFTYLPGVGHLHGAAAAGPQLVKQQNWQLDHICHNPPEFTRDVAYGSCDLPVHCSPSPPPPSSASLPTPLMFPHTSSLLHHPSPSSASALPPQTFTLPPQTTRKPPRMSSAPLHTFTTCPQTSSLLPHTPPIGPQREQPLSMSPSASSPRVFVTPVDPQSDSVLGVKQEPEEQPNLGSLGLQEITLDDVNEIIDRDICRLSSEAPPDQLDQYHQYDWEHTASGGPR